METGVDIFLPVVKMRIRVKWQGLAFDPRHGTNNAFTRNFTIEGAGNNPSCNYFVHRKVDIRDTWKINECSSALQTIP